MDESSSITDSISYKHYYVFCEMHINKQNQ